MSQSINHRPAPLNVHSQIIWFLEKIRGKSTEAFVGNVMLESKETASIKVELHHNLAYRVYKTDSGDDCCVVYWLDFDTSEFKYEDQAQLLFLKYQKRGIPHATVRRAYIIRKITFSLKEVEGMLKAKL
ncbi:hypothetical protein DFH28DRAFT_934795 [Melampsora americana]|nr:hypothetical protein DFH28DRAFT_934795 [Melampsora americana]